MGKNNPTILLFLIFLTGCSGTMPNLGIKHGLLMPCPQTPNCVNSQATDDKHIIQPIYFPGTQKQAESALINVLKSAKRSNVIVTEENYIRAEFTSLVFRFIDDVEFYFPSSEAQETIIHVRSASRVGYSDFGVNRKRIEQIRRALIRK
jgi:uncharacterized protein (DUF1499 family)